jgi:hypothetical protein
MADFQAGDRVRVLNVPGAFPYAGKTGKVSWVRHGADGAVSGYHVRLDDHGTSPRVAVHFRPGELEPEAP